MGQSPWDVVESGYAMSLDDKGSFTVKPVRMANKHHTVGGASQRE